MNEFEKIQQIYIAILKYELPFEFEQIGANAYAFRFCSDPNNINQAAQFEAAKNSVIQNWIKANPNTFRPAILEREVVIGERSSMKDFYYEAYQQL